MPITYGCQGFEQPLQVKRALRVEAAMAITGDSNGSETMRFQYWGSFVLCLTAIVAIVVSYHAMSFAQQATWDKEKVLFEQDLHGGRRAVLCARPCPLEIGSGSQRLTIPGVFLWLTVWEKTSGEMHHAWREWITDAEAESGVGPFALLEKDATTLAFAYVHRRSVSIRVWEINTARRVPVDPQSALTYAKSIARVASSCNTPTNIPVSQLLNKPSDAIGHPERLRIVWKDNGWWVHLEADDMHFVFRRSQSDVEWKVVAQNSPSEEIAPKPQ